MQRRGLLRGLLAAPLVVTTPGLLMPISSRWLRKPEMVMGHLVRHQVYGEPLGVGITFRMAADCAPAIGSDINPLGGTGDQRWTVASIVDEPGGTALIRAWKRPRIPGPMSWQELDRYA